MIRRLLTSPYLLALLLVVLSALTSVLLQSLLFSYPWNKRGDDTSFSNLGSVQFLWLLLAQALPFLGWTVLFLRFAKFHYYVFEFSFKAKEFFLSLGGLFLINALSSALLQLVGVEVKQFEQLDRALLREDPFPFFLAVGVLAPVYEEFVFRGVLFATLYEKARHFFTKALAWLYPALLFTILHYENAHHAMVLLPIFFLALYLTFVTWYHKNIALSVAIHAVQNFIAGLAFLYLPEKP
ncbi:MAG: CPBP family intramembrane metalloprotease [Leptospiraceae bacterium]|nr:CPBP family intramembrane metalloprotease [Leptospiraceae bacterium]MDW8307458.1 CPBP family intramembrane glutamic endopeptidase [Leptospiraceae bacterium]